MILAIDVGNTNTGIGAFEAGNEKFKLVFSLRTRTNVLKIRQLLESINNGTDVGQKAHELMKESGSTKFEGAIISSTVPSVVSEIQKMIGLFYGFTALVVNPKMKMNINIPEEFHADLGADIIVGLEAASTEYKCPLAVVDMGTASTIFVLDENKTFIGGAIHPGVGIELKALCTNTALLPKIDFQIPNHAIGRNTEECIQSGVFYGHAGMVDNILEQMEKELGTHLNAVATGGLGRYIAPLSHRHIEYEDDLLFRGMAILYNKNAEK